MRVLFEDIRYSETARFLLLIFVVVYTLVVVALTM